MTAPELAEWRAFYVVEPFGEEWRQTGEVAAMIGNAAGGKRNGGSFSFRDFLPVKPLLKHMARQSSAQMLAMFRMIATTIKGK